MIDGSVLQSAQQCFEKKSRVVVKMVVRRSKYSRSAATVRTEQKLDLAITQGDDDSQVEKQLGITNRNFSLSKNRF